MRTLLLLTGTCFGPLHQPTAHSIYRQLGTTQLVNYWELHGKPNAGSSFELRAPVTLPPSWSCEIGLCTWLPSGPCHRARLLFRQNHAQRE